MGGGLTRYLHRCRSHHVLVVAAGAALFMLSSMRQGTTLVLGEHLQFGHLKVGATKILSQTLSGTVVAFREMRPILPGHTLVAPVRPVAKLAELSKDEVVDLFEMVRTTQALVKGHVGATAFNLAVFDGAGAGQPVPHVHVHVVPRKPGDLEVNDMVYEMIDKWTPVDGEENAPPPIDFPDDDKRQARTEDAMAAEAARYVAAAGDASGPLPDAAVQFAKFSLKPSQVFFTSKSGLSFATVNLKPLCPGHVLVLPRRVVQYLSDLTAEEMEDLWSTVRQVQAVVLGCHGASSANLGLQDGKDAGQSVPHVHVHILPRADPVSGL